MTVVSMSEASGQAAEMRDALVKRLRADGMITLDAVERAFRRVPREKFVPAGTTLEVAYNADDSVATKRDEYGVIVSSVSAPFIQARMIEQAAIHPGMRVLEVGSGGCNAALLAEIVGVDGRVVSVDIDPEITDRATAVLDATGYGGRVAVVLADAENGAPEYAPFDAVVTTVGTWDIPPAWLEQLTGQGVIVLPLRMGGITRSIAFRPRGDHLESTSAEVCGFVAMQGVGSHAERVFLLPDAQGRSVRLRFDEQVPEGLSLLDGVLAAGRTAVWSGVTIDHGVSFADLHLWFAGFLPGFCKLAADAGTALDEERGSWFPFGMVRGDSFAYLAVRPFGEGPGVEFGARAYGRHGEAAATAMVEQIQAWDRKARGGPGPSFGFWPTGSDRTRVPEGAALFEKAHGLVTISWPAVG